MPSLSGLQGKYNGERAFLIGNGPSLNKTPLEKLNSEYTFVVNKINKIYDRIDFEPTFFFTGWEVDSSYFSSIDSADHPVSHHVNSDVQCFLRKSAYEFYGDQENVFYYTGWGLGGGSCPFHEMKPGEIKGINLNHLYEYWSLDASNLIYKYHSMYCLAQIVAYLGFDEVYFVGTDLGLEYISPHMIFEEGLDPYRFNGGKVEFLKTAFDQNSLLKSVTNAVAMKSIQKNTTNKILTSILDTIERSHFYSENDNPLIIFEGQKANQELIKSHIAIKRIYDDLDINVYNATVGGELEVYPQVDINNILSD